MQTAPINYQSAWRHLRDQITHHGMGEHRAAIVRVLMRLAKQLVLIDGVWCVRVYATIKAVRDKVRAILKRAGLHPETFRTWCRAMFDRFGLSARTDDGNARSNAARCWTMEVPACVVGEARSSSDPFGGLGADEPAPQSFISDGNNKAKAVRVFDAYPEHNRGDYHADTRAITATAWRVQRAGRVEGCAFAYLERQAKAYAASEGATKDGGKWCKQLRNWLATGEYAMTHAPAPKVWTVREWTNREADND